MMWKLLLLTSLLQVDSLPPKEVLFASIDSFYNLKVEQELVAFQNSKKGEWLKYLPSIGITYALDGRPRPALNFNSSLLYRAKKDRLKTQFKRKAIRERLLQEKQTRKLQVEQLIQEYYTLHSELQHLEKIFAVDRQLFLIEKAKYQRLEIKPSSYLEAFKRYLLNEQELFQHQKLLKLKKWKIEKFVFTNFDT